MEARASGGLRLRGTVAPQGDCCTSGGMRLRGTAAPQGDCYTSGGMRLRGIAAPQGDRGTSGGLGMLVGQLLAREYIRSSSLHSRDYSLTRHQTINNYPNPQLKDNKGTNAPITASLFNPALLGPQYRTRVFCAPFGPQSPGQS